MESSETEDAAPQPVDAGDLPPDAVADALAECVRASLERGEPAEVPGLGTFRVEHVPSQMSEQGEENFSVTPPRDTIAFEGER